MSLKPPKYLYLKAKELKMRIPGFTTLELTINRKYKPKEYNSEAEWESPADKWSHSWKQVLRLTHADGFKLENIKTPNHWSVFSLVLASLVLGKVCKSGRICVG